MTNFTIIHSKKLEQFVQQLETTHLQDTFDLVTRAGTDHAHSTPELIDLGVKLALEAQAYNKNAKIFVCTNKTWELCFYQVGIDEDDALERLKEEISLTNLIYNFKKMTI